MSAPPMQTRTPEQVERLRAAVREEAEAGGFRALRLLR